MKILLFALNAAVFSLAFSSCATSTSGEVETPVADVEVSHSTY